LSGHPADAVLIASPTGLHVSMATEALASGCYVYLEKPLAADAKSARELASLSSARERLMVGFNYRFHPLVIQLRRQAHSRSMGNLLGVRTVFSMAESVSPGWKTQRSSGGGVLLDLASHDVDLIRYVTGREILAVSTTLSSRRTEHDTAALTLHLEGDVIAQCLVFANAAETASIEVTGEDGVARCERYRSSCLEVYGKRVGGFAERLRATARATLSFPHHLRRLRHPWNEPSLAFALESFINFVREGSPPSPGVIDGLRTMEVLAAAEASALSGSRTQVSSPLRDTQQIGTLA
jgi:myo-inositol 2-dehydrogenase/D-chiro-inositol 1-dehydrogenase